MTLVSITLDEDEQEALLAVADEIANDRGILTPWEAIAEKIRRAQNGKLFEIYSPPDNRLEAERIANAGNHS